MVTSSGDETLCLWDLEGFVLKKMKGHGCYVTTVAVSGNGKLIASGDVNGELIAWDGNTGESLTRAIKAHSENLASLDFSPNSAMLATASCDGTIKVWRTDIWQIHGNPINVGESIDRVRYSPSGHRLATAAFCYIQIWNPSGSECIAKLTATTEFIWTPDGTRLFSAGRNFLDSTIWEWDTSSGRSIQPFQCSELPLCYLLRG